MQGARYYSKPGFDLGAVWKDRNLAQHQSNPGQITDLGTDLFDGRIHSANW
jgi:hypothetical protein